MNDEIKGITSLYLTNFRCDVPIVQKRLYKKEEKFYFGGYEQKKYKVCCEDFRILTEKDVDVVGTSICTDGINWREFGIKEMNDVLDYINDQGQYKITRVDLQGKLLLQPYDDDWGRIGVELKFNKESGNVYIECETSHTIRNLREEEMKRLEVLKKKEDNFIYFLLNNHSPSFFGNDLYDPNLMSIVKKHAGVIDLKDLSNLKQVDVIDQKNQGDVRLHGYDYIDKIYILVDETKEETKFESVFGYMEEAVLFRFNRQQIYYYMYQKGWLKSTPTNLIVIDLLKNYDLSQNACVGMIIKPCPKAVYVDSTRF